MTGAHMLVVNVVAAQAGAEAQVFERLPIAGSEERRLIAMGVDRGDDRSALAGGADARVVFVDRGSIDVGAAAQRGILPLVRDLEHSTGALRLEVPEECAAETGSQQERSRKVGRAIGGVNRGPNRHRSEAVVAERQTTAHGLLAIESEGRVRAATISGHLGGGERARLLAILRR